MADTIFSTQFAEGAAKAKQIVAPGSLERLSADPAIQAALAQQQQLAQGMSSQEMQAQRELAGQEINRQTQTQQRALQAQLARSGVKGGIAGAQLRDVAIGGVAQKAQLEKQLMVENRAAQEKSLSNYLNSVAQIKQFDIGQTQAEKNIELQTGLAFSGMGSAERSAALLANAQTSAAQLQADAQKSDGPLGTSGVARVGLAVATGGLSEVFCLEGSVEIEMEDGSLKAIKDIKLGDRVKYGGAVTFIGAGYAFQAPDSDMYSINGEEMTGSHVVYENGWKLARDHSEAIRTAKSDRTVVYPMDVENEIYSTKNGLISYQFSSVEGAFSPEENLKILNEMERHG